MYVDYNRQQLSNEDRRYFLSRCVHVIIGKDILKIEVDSQANNSVWEIKKLS